MHTYPGLGKFRYYRHFRFFRPIFQSFLSILSVKSGKTVGKVGTVENSQILDNTQHMLKMVPILTTSFARQYVWRPSHLVLCSFLMEHVLYEYPDPIMHLPIELVMIMLSLPVLSEITHSEEVKTLPWSLIKLGIHAWSQSTQCNDSHLHSMNWVISSHLAVSYILGKGIELFMNSCYSCLI